MTSPSTGSPRPLTDEELAVQHLYNAVAVLRDVQRMIDTAWASLPAELHTAPGAMAAATMARLAADGLQYDLDGLTERAIIASTEPETEMVPWWEAIRDGRVLAGNTEPVDSSWPRRTTGSRIVCRNGAGVENSAHVDGDGMVSVLRSASPEGKKGEASHG